MYLVAVLRLPHRRTLAARRPSADLGPRPLVRSRRLLCEAGVRYRKPRVAHLGAYTWHAAKLASPFAVIFDDIIDLMVRLSRHEVIVATVTAVLGVIAAAVAAPTLHRRLSASPASSEGVAPKVKPTAPPPGDGQAAPESTEPGNGPRPSVFKRARVYVRRRLTPTVLVLVVVGLAIGWYANHLRPASAPQPEESNVTLHFGPNYFTSAALKVTVWLRQEPSNNTFVAMDIDLTGQDLTQPGWYLLAFVPRGVQVPGSVTNDPREGRVTHPTSGPDVVYITPGPQRDGTYSAMLLWTNLTDGPLQVRDANLVATFPQFTVENRVAADSPSTFTPPTPAVTLGRKLQPGGSDYAYLGGLPPDHQDRFTWTWNPVRGDSAGGTTSFTSSPIAARSASADEESHSKEFTSGVLFGVAAAALVAALAEFLNSARKDGSRGETRKTRKPRRR
jgi:hypothetical protein